MFDSSTRSPSPRVRKWLVAPVAIGCLGVMIFTPLCAYTIDPLIRVLLRDVLALTIIPVVVPTWVEYFFAVAGVICVVWQMEVFVRRHAMNLQPSLCFASISVIYFALEWLSGIKRTLLVFQQFTRAVYGT